MAKTARYEIFQTPLVELVFPHLNEPDTRWDPNGKYQTLAAVSPEAAQDLIAQAERVRDAEFAMLDTVKSAKYGKTDVYEYEYTRPDKDATEEEKAAFVPEPTGRILFKCKLNAIVKPREGEPFSQSVILIDEKEEPVTLPVWGGTKAFIRGQLVPYTTASTKQVGVSFRMKAVKVMELVTGEGSTWTQFD